MRKQYIVPAARFRNVRINKFLMTSEPVQSTDNGTDVQWSTETKPGLAESGEEAAGKGGWLDFD